MGCHNIIEAIDFMEEMELLFQSCWMMGSTVLMNSQVLDFVNHQAKIMCDPFEKLQQEEKAKKRCSFPSKEKKNKVSH